MWGAVAIYAVAFVATFGTLHDSMQISTITLVGLVGWLYGTRIALFSILPFILLNTAILYWVSGKGCDILLAYNPLGILLAIISAWVAGSLKKSQDQLNETEASLAGRVEKATAELNELAQKLLEKDEQEQIHIGQDLHDGVGQYLTGMLLHSEALSLQLREAGREEADLAEWMTRRVQKNIQIVRQLSRALLPIEFTQMSLGTALDELVVCFGHISTANIEMKSSGDTTNIPSPTAQHLYRITHEATNRAIHKYKATSVLIQLTADDRHCRLKIEGSKIAPDAPAPSKPVSEVMKYRIRAIGGQQTFRTHPDGSFVLECSVRFDAEGGS
jgi:signal transduction histidine kinase